MKTKAIALIALTAILLSVIATAAYASTTTSTSTSSTASSQSGENQGNGNHGDHGDHAKPLSACSSLTVGQSFTISGLVGQYSEVNNPSTTGTAAGTFTFQVSAEYSEGCTLTLTGGSFTLGSTSYTVTGGSIVLNRGGSGEGTGTTSSGTFLISISGLHDPSTTSSTSTGNSDTSDTATTTTTTTTTSTAPTIKIGAIGLDFKTGANEFLVHLHSPPVPVDSDEGPGEDE